ncbi:type II toxin-antitoxin system ParD family antitoxin [Rhizobium sp. PL01]|jgi:antitoxin ParD1/3/4|uniref:type II toxin-antitoxin system ParD family antitoxin n=1 Tax=Rhizobium sp. PL01 TaxID=3085631 RepID=UPI0029810215|nr:type II toxin-antitoxin system ParD family antitoxin [Rhizobium sp. PL01]MDW5317141.1 type II toxin-antitoxin system ParD family antitoxin [Rhizobium sp. PL01]
MRSSKPITVSLGKQQAGIETRVASGAYESASEVVRAALRALDREEAALDEVLRAKVQEAIDDPRPSIPAEDVFGEMRAFHADRVKASKRGA